MKVYDGSTLLGSVTANGTADPNNSANKAWSYTVGGTGSEQGITTLSDGTHSSMTATATDAANNTSGRSPPLSVTIDTAPPVAAPPAHSLLKGSRLGTSTSSPANYVPVRLGWSAQDASGIAKYELQRSTNGGAFSNVPLSSPTATTATVNLAPGSSTYRFQVRVTDATGNVSAFALGPAFVVDASQESSTRIVDTGSWTTAALSGSYGGSVQYAGASGRLATYSVPAGRKSVAWVSTLANNRGKAEVTLIENGARKAPVAVDLYSASQAARSVVFTQALDPNKSYKVEVKVLGTKNASSSGTRVDVDAFLATS